MNPYIDNIDKENISLKYDLLDAFNSIEVALVSPIADRKELETYIHEMCVYGMELTNKMI